MKWRLALLLLLGLCVSPVRADAPAAQVDAAAATAPSPAVSELRLKTEPVRGDSKSMGAASAQMVLGLAAVLAVIFALAWLARRFNLSGVGVTTGMRVLGALAVGPKEKILMVEVEGKRLLLGVTAHQISLLQTWDPDAETPDSADFAGKIQALLKTGPLHEK
ncbi:MAG: flagellar biosynthetic protein FliO [Pseudomonadota bacterium]